MTHLDTIQTAFSDGVKLSLSPAGKIEATGDPAAVSRWLPIIKEQKAAIVEALETTSRHWLIHFADRDPLPVLCVPPAAHAEILASYPDAVAAEPYTPTVERPAAPMTLAKGETQ